jgi:hypothetical protein
MTADQLFSELGIGDESAADIAEKERVERATRAFEFILDKYCLLPRELLMIDPKLLVEDFKESTGQAIVDPGALKRAIRDYLMRERFANEPD